ncbi:hypothetical protein KC950_02890 [Candidatus Saccharibacteria bacterium]|nr:hypothetical protein [Candidatus Saccharibacteria bacterium]
MAAPKTKSRAKKKPKYKSFRIAPRIKPPVQKNLSPVPKLLKDTSKHMWSYKKLFFGIIAIFLLLNLLFVKGLSSSTNIPELKNELNETLGFSGLELNTALFGEAISTGTTANGSEGGIYQTIIFIFIFLAFVWAFRQTGTKPKKVPLIKQAFYDSTSSIVPFILVTFVVGLQLIPMIIGITVYGVVQSNGLAVTGLEQILWIILTFLLSLLSIYMLSSSLFAMIIVTLPDMKPMKALRSARQVVAFRRWLIVRKIITMVIIMAVLFSILVFITIYLIPWFTEWMVLLLSSYIFALIIGSGYRLYRELL